MMIKEQMSSSHVIFTSRKINFVTLAVLKSQWIRC